MKFHKAIVIYNPNSTGNSQKNAEQFTEHLKKEIPELDIELTATKFAGHAEEIAAEYAGDESTIIISASGDGGYNEVVNGVLSNGAAATTAVLPSGNANDHHRAVGSDNLVQSIKDGEIKKIEVMLLEWKKNSEKLQTRYAHSYIGLGLTPKVGKVLTEVRPNVISEKWHVLKHALKFKHVTIMVENEKKRYSNLIFATIDRMSKVVKLDDDTSINDGMMEVYKTKFTSLFGTIKLLFSIGLGGISSSEQVEKFDFQTCRPTLIQLDGEVLTVDTGSNVTVSCQKSALQTLA